MKLYDKYIIFGPNEESETKTARTFQTYDIETNKIHSSTPSHTKLINSLSEYLLLERSQSDTSLMQKLPLVSRLTKTRRTALTVTSHSHSNSSISNFVCLPSGELEHSSLFYHKCHMLCL